jgi:hypothetical protein
MVDFVDKFYSREKLKAREVVVGAGNNKYRRRRSVPISFSRSMMLTLWMTQRDDSVHVCRRLL